MTYKCTATICILVETDDEYEAPYLAGMEMDIGDIEWDVEPTTDPYPHQENITILPKNA